MVGYNHQIVPHVGSTPNPWRDLPLFQHSYIAPTIHESKLLISPNKQTTPAGEKRKRKNRKKAHKQPPYYLQPMIPGYL